MRPHKKIVYCAHFGLNPGCASMFTLYFSDQIDKREFRIRVNNLPKVLSSVMPL